MSCSQSRRVDLYPTFRWSRWVDLNHRPPPSEGGILPLNYSEIRTTGRSRTSVSTFVAWRRVRWTTAVWPIPQDLNLEPLGFNQMRYRLRQGPLVRQEGFEPPTFCF